MPWIVVTDDPGETLIVSDDYKSDIAMVAAGPFHDQILDLILTLEPKGPKMPPTPLPSASDPFWSTPAGNVAQAKLTAVFNQLNPSVEAVPWAQILAAIEAILQVLIPIFFPPTPTPPAP